MENYASWKKWLICIAIFTCASIGILVSPIVQTLATVFPDTPMSTIRSITTIPSLMSFFCGLFLSSVVGKKISYKGILVIGMTLGLIGGVLPMFWHPNFTAIIIARVIYGLGFSVFAMRNAIITKAFGLAESAKWTGYGFFVGNGISVIFQLLAGRLGDIDWRYCFGLHAVCLVTLTIILLLFKEPAKEETPAASEVKAEKAALNPQIFIYFFITLMGTLCLYPILSSISTFVAERNLGGATQSGWVSSAYTVGGAILGFTFAKANKALGRWLAPAACLLCILGYVLTLAATGTVLLAMVGCLLCGGGFSWFMLSTTQWARGISVEGNRTLHMTIISSAVSGGSFISSYFIAFAKKAGSLIPLFETEMEKSFLVGILIYIVLFVVLAVKDWRPDSVKE